jgi:hypothetical protein
MKRFLKAPVILALTSTVLIFSVYCCCFIYLAQAKEQAPSCHQTGQQTDQSHDGQKCDCHKNIAAYNQIEKTSGIDFTQLISSLIFDHVGLGWKVPTQLSNRALSESPPFWDNSTPLFILHHTLRI